MTRQKTLLKRDEVLEKGIQIMWQKGYNGTGIQEIVDAAGVPKGSFYNYFKSKEAFAIEALRAYLDEQYNEMKALLRNQEIAPIERLKQLYDKRIVWAKIRENADKGCFITNICQEMGGINASLAVTVNQLFNQMAEPIKSCLEEAQQRGELNANLEVDQMAEFMENSWRGALAAVKVRKNCKPLEVFRNLIFEQVLV